MSDKSTERDHSPRGEKSYPSLRFDVVDDMTLEQLATLAATAPPEAVVRTPHLGAQHGNQMGVLLSELAGVAVHALDMNTLQRDRDFAPGYRVVPTASGKPNGLVPITEIGEVDRFVAHSSTNTSVKVNGTTFPAGVPLSDVHLASIRAVAASPDRIRTMTEVYQSHEAIYVATLQALRDLKLVDLVRRVVHSDGSFAELDDPGQKLGAIEKLGFHRLDDKTDQAEGVVVPLEAMLVLDALIRGYDTGLSELWHIAGNDMIKYVQTKDIKRATMNLFQVAYANLPASVRSQISSSIRMHIVPGSGLRFFGSEADTQLLDGVLSALSDFESQQGIAAEARVAHSRLLGASLKELQALKPGVEPPDMNARVRELLEQLKLAEAQSASAEEARAVIGSILAEYPEPALAADAANCVTQWHILEGKTPRALTFASRARTMTMGQLAAAQSSLAKIYGGTE